MQILETLSNDRYTRIATIYLLPRLLASKPTGKVASIMADDHAATTALIAAYNKKEDLPELVEETMHGFVQPVPEGLIPVRGYEFGKDGVDYHALLQSYKTCGFQATNFGLAVEQIIQMVSAAVLSVLRNYCMPAWCKLSRFSRLYRTRTVDLPCYSRGKACAHVVIQYMQSLC